MNRDSELYKLRRKMQVLASHVLAPETLSKIYYRLLVGRNLNLDNPKSFTEKIQWLKLYNYATNSLVSKCADKFAVREYLAEKGLENILVPLLYHWDSPKDIDWDILPEQFVLKCNHGCAYNVLCPDKKNLDVKKTVEKLNQWMSEDFGAFNIEPHYSPIKPKITCEKYLGDMVVDYKFFCFHGEPKFLYASSDDSDGTTHLSFFNLDGTRIPVDYNAYADFVDFTLPPFYEELLKDARILSQDFPFVRVDFFVFKDKFYFAELTFAPGAGFMEIKPEKFDYEWGEYLNLDTGTKKTIKTPQPFRKLNILYVSKLNNKRFIGPANSIPAQVKAQSEIDNVFWLNVKDQWGEHWSAPSFKYAYGAKYEKIGLAEVEKIFTTPDVIVFEGFYEFPFSKLADDAVKNNIPYVIIPRSQLTTEAQKQKALKKFLGNALYFKKFLSNAAAVHFLTPKEQENSSQWNVSSFIIPNGIELHEYIKRPTPKDAIEAIYIGRINTFQKGFDLLLAACAKIKDALTNYKFHLTIYGASSDSETQDVKKLDDMIQQLGLDKIIERRPPVFGDEKSNAYQKADMFLMTSRFEGLPMSILEALSYSLPCFVTTGTNMAQEIKESGAGAVADVDEQSIADELLKMLQSFLDNYERMGKNAHLVAQKYSWEEIAKLSHEFYQGLTV